MNTKITFHFILADNDVDWDDEAFTNGALEEICKLCIGHYGLFDGTEVKAKITNASIMDSCGATKDGRQKRFIYAEAEFPNNECGRKLISKILLEKPVASISCSVLNRDKVADGVTMISNVTDFYEFSLRFDEEKETMDKNELERRLEAAEKQNLRLLDEIKNLKAQLAEMQDEPEIPYFPTFKSSEAYFFCDAKLDVRRTAFPASRTNHVSMDFNAFRTSEYAQLFADKCKLIAMMLHCKFYLCCDYKPDFNNGCSQKWTVVFNYNEGIFTVEFSRLRECSAIYFDAEENAQKCADWLNEHWKEDGNG